MPDSAPWYRWAVAVYDRSYRLVHGLDRAGAQAGPMLRVDARRLRRALRLADGTQLGRGARIGVLHLNNSRALALHGEASSPGAIGFEFRRLFLLSLRAVAARAAEGGALAPLEAYSATTLFHHRLPRLGFGPAPGDRPLCERLVSRYERALLRSLHPAVAAPGRRRVRREARRLWISRARLLAMYAAGPVDPPRPPGRARQAVPAP